MLLNSVSFSAPLPSLPRYASASPQTQPAPVTHGDTYQPTLSWESTPTRAAAPQQPVTEMKPRSQSFAALMDAALQAPELDGWNFARI